MGIELHRFRIWRRRSRPAPATARIIPRFEAAAPPVPPQYLSLYQYLEHRYAARVVLTFEQIEALLGSSLPSSATAELDWWTAAAITKSHSAAWTQAGRTAVPNLMARTVTFERPS